MSPGSGTEVSRWFSCCCGQGEAGGKPGARSSPECLGEGKLEVPILSFSFGSQVARKVEGRTFCGPKQLGRKGLYLKGREIERGGDLPSTDSLSKCLQCPGLVQAETRSWNSVWIPHTGGRALPLEPSPAATQSQHQQEAGFRSRPGAQTRHSRTGGRCPKQHLNHRAKCSPQKRTSVATCSPVFPVLAGRVG